jgi:hypothetical protein
MPLVTFNAIGYTTTVGTTFTPIVATTYVEQAVNAQRSIVSSSPVDFSAGTGARTLRLTYFDQTMAGPFTEDVVLNGTTPVNTTNVNICFIESMVILTVGAQLGNVGTISLKAAAAGAGVTVGSIAPGDNRTQWAHHYIGLNRVASITNVIGLIKGLAAGEVHMRAATPTVANTPEQTIAPILTLAPGVQGDLTFPSPIVVFGPTRVVLYAKSVLSANQDWFASFGYGEG